MASLADHGQIKHFQIEDTAEASKLKEEMGMEKNEKEAAMF